MNFLTNRLVSVMTVTLLTLFTTQLFANGGGVLPIYGDEVLIGLETRHNKRTKKNETVYSDFGGKQDQGEDIIATAVRECREETAGVIQLGRQDLSSSNQDVYKHVRSFRGGFTYTTFLVRMQGPKPSVQTFIDAAQSGQHKNVEKTHWKYIKIRDLLNHGRHKILSRKGAHPLFGPFAQALQNRTLQRFLTERELPPRFKGYRYIYSHPDLFRALGHLTGSKLEQAAQDHWFSAGWREGRKTNVLPKGFNFLAYMYKYPDLTEAWQGHIGKWSVLKREAEKHYLRHAATEGRDMFSLPDGFQAHRYIFSHPDLATEYGKLGAFEMLHQAVRHYILCGEREGRVLSLLPAEFQAQRYAYSHRDLAKQWRSKRPWEVQFLAEKHYLLHGRHEAGRVLSALPSDFDHTHPDYQKGTHKKPRGFHMWNPDYQRVWYERQWLLHQLGL